MTQKSVWRKWWWYDPNRNVLYINSEAILPDTTGMSWKEHSKAIKGAFKMSYQERIEAFANEEQKKAILEAIATYPEATLSEYCNA